MIYDDKGNYFSLFPSVGPEKIAVLLESNKLPGLQCQGKEI
jgi:hypothetical protein